MLTRQQLELTIDELIFNGFHHINENIVRATIAQELNTLLNKQGIKNIPTKATSIDTITADAINIAKNASSETIGRNVAHSIYNNLNL